MESYEWATTEWEFKNYFDVSGFDVIFTHVVDGKIVAAYMLITPESEYSSDVSNILETTNKPTDGTKAIRLNDPDLIKKVLGVTQPGAFGKG